MSDYIEDRIKRLEKKLDEHIDKTALDGVHMLELLTRVNMLDHRVFGTPLPSHKSTDQSTEEFVRVVRCKDCNHYDKMVGFCLNGICIATEPDDYCSRGEKR